MQDTTKYLKVLIRIHDANNECLTLSELLEGEEDDQEVNQIIQRLIDEDLIEFIEKENVYYLTYDGYGVVEENRESVKPVGQIQKSEIEQYKDVVNQFGGTKKLQKIVLGLLFSAAILGSIYFYLNPEANKSNPSDIKHKINQETLDGMKEQLEGVIDSIQEAKKLENE